MEKNLTSAACLAELGERFRQYRISMSLTQQDVAAQSGVSVRSISRFEAGGDIQLRNYLKLLRSLNLQESIMTTIPDLRMRPSYYLSNTKTPQRVRQKKNADQYVKSGFQWGDEQ